MPPASRRGKTLPPRRSDPVPTVACLYAPATAGIGSDAATSYGSLTCRGGESAAAVAPWTAPAALFRIGAACTRRSRSARLAKPTAAPRFTDACTSHRRDRLACISGSRGRRGLGEILPTLSAVTRRMPQNAAAASPEATAPLIRRATRRDDARVAQPMPAVVRIVLAGAVDDRKAPRGGSVFPRREAGGRSRRRPGDPAHRWLLCATVETEHSVIERPFRLASE